MNDNLTHDPRVHAIPDIHGHAKGEHKAYAEERPIPLSARMLFLWFYHACKRGWPRFLMVTDHMNYLTFEDPAAIALVRRALKLAQAGDLYGAAETASVDVAHAAAVSEGLRRGMRYSIGAEVDNDPRSRPDSQNIVDAMKPDGTIRSVHFVVIDHPTHGPNWNWPFDNPEFVDVYDVVGTAKTWELYMATLLDAIERLPGHIVGHFYVPAKFGHWPDDETLERYEDQLVAACEARGMAVEFNTRFLYRDNSDEERARYLAAHRRLLAKCKAKNVGIAIGSDAHSPKDQGAAFATVLALLDECEINELVFPIGGRLARVALRVERKAEPVAEAAVPEERKPVRKERPTETPVRETGSATRPDRSEGAKHKPRPKRILGDPAPLDQAASPSASPPGEPLADESALEDVAAAAAGEAGTVAAEPPRATDEPAVPHAAASPAAPETEAVPAPTQPVEQGAGQAASGAAESVAAHVAEPAVPHPAEVQAVEPKIAEAEPLETERAEAPPVEHAPAPPVEHVAAEPVETEPVAAAPAQTESLEAQTVEPQAVEAQTIEVETIEPEVVEAEFVVADGPGPQVADTVRKPRAAAAKKSPAARAKATAKPKVAAKKAKPAAKPAAKKKLSAVKKAATAKAGAKSSAGKAGAAKSPGKAVAKKAVAKKPTAKKSVAKKAAVRTAAAKKAAPKKTVAAKKARSKKTAPRRR